MADIEKIGQDQSDEALAVLAQGGDQVAFGVLVRRYEAKLLRYAGRLLFSSDLDPADVVQDTFVKAYVNLRSFDASRRFSPWVYRIAHNELVNAVRKKAREMVDFYDFSSFLPSLPSSASSEGQVDLGLLREELEKGLDGLPATYREPLVLFAFEGMSYVEIAEILHLPTSTVGVRISRGKKRLRELCAKLADH